MGAIDNQHPERVYKKLTDKERLIFYELRDAKSWQEWNEPQRNLKLKNFVDSFFKLNNDDVKILIYQIIRSLNRQIDVEKAIKPLADEKKQTSSVVEIQVNGIPVCQIITQN